MGRIWKLGEICVHDSLGRKCELCAAEDDIAELTARIARLQAEVRAWRDWLKECQTIPLANCTCEDVPRGHNLIKARGIVDRNKDLG